MLLRVALGKPSDLKRGASFAQEIERVHAEALGELLQRRQGQVALTSFEGSEIRAVDAELVGELLLTEAESGAVLAHTATDDELKM